MPTVLIVDDDVMNRDLLQTVFERSGFSVVSVSSGESALRLAPECRPSLVICDVVLGDMNGYDVTRALRAHEATRQTPVIILSAYQEELQRQAAEQAGANDFVSKLSGWGVLMERVRLLVG